MSANFTPDMTGYKGLSPFRFWCQKTLPLVYDDSLSYYELLCKVVSYINNLITDVAAAEENVDKLLTAYNQLQEYVNNYFDGADFQQKIDDSLDRYAEDGTLSAMVNTHVRALLPYEVGQQIGDVVDEQLPPVVDLKLGGVVDNKLPAVVDAKLEDVVRPMIVPAVSGLLPQEVGRQLPNEVETQLPAAIGEDLGTIAPPVIQQWLNDHPDATTSVEDGSISLVKLNTVLQRLARLDGNFYPAEYDPTVTYNTDDMCTYRNTLTDVERSYKCIATSTTGTFSASDWAVVDENDIVINARAIYDLASSIAPVYRYPNNPTIPTGTIFFYRGNARNAPYGLWRATTDIPAATFVTPSNAERVTILDLIDGIDQLESDVADLKSAFDVLDTKANNLLSANFSGNYKQEFYWESGSISTSTGEDSVNASFLRTKGFYSICDGATIKNEAGEAITAFYYNSSGVFQSAESIPNNYEHFVTTEKGTYYRFRCSTSAILSGIVVTNEITFRKTLSNVVKDEEATHIDAFSGYVVNPQNTLPDYRLDHVTAITLNVTVESGIPTNILKISNTADSTPVENASLVVKMAKSTLQNIHVKLNAKRNASFAYKTPSVAVYLYENNSLRGSTALAFTSPSTTEYSGYQDITATVTPGYNINKMVLLCPYGFDIALKELYIVEGTDSTPMFRYATSKQDVIDLIDTHPPRGDNGIKLAIIGDSLSAEDSSVTIKYHDLLAQNNGYDVENVAVSGSSYCGGSLKNGTRDHYFYNQASRIANDTEAVLVFGSFNDMTLLNGRVYLYNSSDEIIYEYAAGVAPSSSATLLSTDSSVAPHYYYHNADSEIAAGTYRMVCDGVTYQFTTTNDCPSGGKVCLRIVTLGEIGTDDSDTDSIVGSFTTMLTNLYTKNNGMAIGIVSPTPWILYNNVSPVSAAALTSCTAYVNKLKELANHYMLPFMMLYEESNLRPWNADFRTTYYNNADGVHPNNLGHATFIYPHMREFLRKYNFKNIV